MRLTKKMAEETIEIVKHYAPALAKDLKRAFDAKGYDRSCFTCASRDDANYCHHWKQAIPEQAMEEGCDKWIDYTAPF